MTNHVISKLGYGISKDCLSEVELIELRKVMTVKPIQTSTIKSLADESFPIYKESTKKIYLPKAYGLEKYGPVSEENMKLNLGSDLVDIEFEGTLREEQHAPVDAFMKACADPSKMGGILNMPCASGKTAMAIFIMCSLKKKTLIIVHKEFLVDQWKERIKQFAPKAKIGLIQGSKIDIDNKDVVIGLLQSISMRDYDPVIFSSFGLLVVDEIHRSAAEVFSKALGKLNIMYSLGLSATIKRKDGLHNVFLWHIGQIVFKGKNNKDEDNIINFKQHAFKPRNAFKEHTLRNGTVNFSRMINDICESGPRTSFIVEIILDTFKTDHNRKMLVLSDRRGHLEALSALISTSSTLTCGFYFGGMKQEELKNSETRDVILGTFQMSQEGLDIKGLDTLVLASSKTDIIQACGRILRDKPCDRKNNPLIIDITDDHSVFASQAKKRLSYLKKFCK